ncbi:MAG: V-type ATP synthase subunit D [Eubacteriales bacterium]|nr:V-type ATP synthase subunit D [Eubacteriales bacterium]
MPTVNPTRMELTKNKKRLTTATRGHKLLKDKQDEMARQFMIYIRRDRQLRVEIESLLGKAMGKMSLAEAEMGRTSLEEAMMISAASAPPVCAIKNIMSVRVPEITRREGDSVNGGLSYGFAFSSDKLDSAVLAMNELMPKLYELASVEKICAMLADEMERTRRRVNALEYIMIPEMRTIIKYISMKLEDNERANTIRLMKIKDQMSSD